MDMSGKELIEALLAKRNITLADLARELAYKERTLRGVLYGEKMTDKMRSQLERELQRSPNLYTDNLQFKEGQVSVIREEHASMKTRQPHIADDTIDLLSSLLHDFQHAPNDVKRRWLAKEIVELAKHIKELADKK